MPATVITKAVTDHISKEKMLLNYAEVSSKEFLDCTVRHVQNLVARGLMPGPVMIGGNVRFRRQEILDWIAAGCPAVAASPETVAAR